jgi:hypothetical protein
MSDSADIELETLREAVERAVTSLDTGFAAVMRQHLAQHRSDNLTIYGPALTCLTLCVGFDGKRDGALGAATALALLLEAGRVFLELEEPPAGTSIAAEWGMPRSLNAGDGFHALAKDKLAHAASSLPADRAAGAASTFDAAARAFAEALGAPSSSPVAIRIERAGGAIYPAAVSLAGIFAGADTMTTKMFEQMGTEMAEGIAKMADADFTGPRVRLELNKASTQILHLRDQR